MKSSAVICGFYGNYNLGDEAMLSGMINLLNSCKSDLALTVLSADPLNTQKRYGVEAVSIRGRRKLLARAVGVAQCEYFILGGGDLLRDSIETSVAADWLRHLSWPLRLGKKVIILGISVGEIWRKETIELIREKLNSVHFIAVRDQVSKTKLEKFGVTTNIQVMGDLALEAFGSANKEDLHHQKFERRSPQIGISIRHLHYRGRTTAQVDYHSLIKEFATVVDRLSQEYNANIHFLPLRSQAEKYHSSDDDYVSSLEVLRYTQQPSKVIVHRDFESIEKFQTVLSQLDLVIGMRLHSLILASALGKPVIAAEYDPKVGNFMSEIGLGQNSISLDDFTADTVMSKVKEIFSEYESVTEQVQSRVSAYQEMTSECIKNLSTVM